MTEGVLQRRPLLNFIATRDLRDPDTGLLNPSK